MDSRTWNDPIVEETRALREALFRECDCDLDKLHALILESQKRHGERLVGKKSLHKKAVSTNA